MLATIFLHRKYKICGLDFHHFLDTLILPYFHTEKKKRMAASSFSLDLENDFLVQTLNSYVFFVFFFPSCTILSINHIEYSYFFLFFLSIFPFPGVCTQWYAPIFVWKINECMCLCTVTHARRLRQMKPLGYEPKQLWQRKPETIIAFHLII